MSTAGRVTFGPWTTHLWETDARGSFSGGVLLNIECKAWAQNIKHDRKERRGSVHLELMVD